MKSAFTAVVRNGYFIGRADEGISGYSPQPTLGQFTSYKEACEKSDELNKSLGLSKIEALKIVGSTMGARKS